MTLAPFRYLRRRRRLRQAVQDEVFFLRRAYGTGAYAAAVLKLTRTDLTRWGRLIVKSAARELKRTAHKEIRPPLGGLGAGVGSVGQGDGDGRRSRRSCPLDGWAVPAAQVGQVGTGWGQTRVGVHAESP